MTKKTDLEKFIEWKKQKDEIKRIKKFSIENKALITQRKKAKGEWNNLIPDLSNI